MSDRTHTHTTGQVIAIPAHVPDEDVEGYANRIVTDAEARQADERATLKTIGKGSIGFVGLGVGAHAAMVTHDHKVAAAALVASALAFGIVTLEQLREWRGHRQGGD